MKKFYNLLFSMQSMGILILIFAFSIGAATFIENDFGTIAAKAVVYNAVWFDILLFLLAVNLVGNIFRYKMYRLKKWPVFTFHLAFLIILTGAAITRFISFEGSMHIRQGESSNQMLSDKTYVIANVTDGNKTVTSEKKVLLSVLSPNDYSDKITIGDTKVLINTKEYIPNATESVTTAKNGVPYAILAASAGMGRQSYYMTSGMEQRIGGYLLTWNKNVEVLTGFSEDELKSKFVSECEDQLRTFPLATRLFPSVFRILTIEKTWPLIFETVRRKSRILFTTYRLCRFLGWSMSIKMYINQF